MTAPSVLAPQPVLARSLGVLLSGPCGVDLRPGAWPGLLAQAPGFSVGFDGVLHDHADLASALDLRPSASAAELFLAGYQRWGMGILKRVRGMFGVVICDARNESVHLVRDPLGAQPMFYSQVTGGLEVSNKLPDLLQTPGVNTRINRAAILDQLRHVFPSLEETYYESILRVPPGHVVTFRRGARHVERYWDPAESDGSVRWLGSDALEIFEATFEKTIQRFLRFGRAGIYLSGGLDSVSVAASAIDVSENAGLDKPLALSLAFPGDDVDESAIQRGVARTLGLDQILAPFFQAVGQDALLPAALELNRTWPVPMMTPWLPAYNYLARAGASAGCKVVLTGGGGDEWLCVSPRLAADLARAVDLAGFIRLWKVLQRSYKVSTARAAYALIWRSALRPILGDAWRRSRLRTAFGEINPEYVQGRRKRRIRKAIASWLAPDPALKEHAVERHLSMLGRRPPQGSFYLRDVRASLDHPLVSLEAEEQFESGSRAGVRLLRPYWDADLVELLYRTPPDMLNANGRTKGLVRGSLARKFPDLGFGSQKKVDGTGFFATEVFRSARQCWRQTRGLPCLTSLGIVDAAIVESQMETWMKNRPKLEAYHLWDLLRFESWLQART